MICKILILGSLLSIVLSLHVEYFSFLCCLKISADEDGMCTQTSTLLSPYASLNATNNYFLKKTKVAII